MVGGGGVGALLFSASPLGASPLICFSNEAGRPPREPPGVPSLPHPVIDEPSAPRPRGPAALLVERRPIHPDNTPTTHLAAVCTETQQSRPPLLAPTDSVDQTVARSLGLLLKIDGAPVSHTLQQRQRLLFPPLLLLLLLTLCFKGILEKTVFQNGPRHIGKT